MTGRRPPEGDVVRRRGRAPRGQEGTARAGRPAGGQPRTGQPRTGQPRGPVRSGPPPRRRPPAPPRRRPPRRVRLADSHHRLRVALVVAVFALSLLGGRVVQLQGIDASTYAVAARSELTTSVTLTAPRGDIVDRHGVALATTSEGRDVTVDQTQVTNSAAYALQLAPLLGRTELEVQQAMTGEARYAKVAKGVSPQTWSRVQALGLQGVYSEVAPRRTYPAGAVGGNVVGLLSHEGHGAVGLERAYDDVLAGADGKITYERDRAGRRIPLGDSQRTDPVAGSGLRLTLDRDVQWYAQQALAERVAAAGAVGGTAVVLDAKTQEVLAMASTPVVDPSNPAATPPEQLGNPVVEQAYEPGSVQKVITSAAVIEEGAVAPDTPFTVPMTLQRGSHTVRDSVEHPEGLTYAGVLARSSNIGTLLAAERLPSKTLEGYLRAFGFGSPPRLGFTGETAGKVPTRWTGLTRDTVAFGQSLSANILQMASAYATVANGGVRVPPSLVSAVVDADGTEHPVEKGVATQVVSRDTADAVTMMMEGVMGEGGTGHRVQVPGYRVAGKTGTAQRVNPETRSYSGGGNIVSFMGFAPAEDPAVVVAVTIDRPTGGGSGSGTAGPVFADVMSFTLQKLGVPPSTAPAPSVTLFSS